MSALRSFEVAVCAIADRWVEHLVVLIFALVSRETRLGVRLGTACELGCETSVAHPWCTGVRQSTPPVD